MQHEFTGAHNVNFGVTTRKLYARPMQVVSRDIDYRLRLAELTRSHDMRRRLGA